jgi:hypothetical protein
MNKIGESTVKANTGREWVAPSVRLPAARAFCSSWKLATCQQLSVGFYGLIN